MSKKKIERLGERNYNAVGDLMVIIEYNNNKDVLVQFPMYPNVVKKTTYYRFKNGNVYLLKKKCMKDVQQLENERKVDNKVLFACVATTIAISTIIWAFTNLL
jgi:hypothetical protein